MTKDELLRKYALDILEAGIEARLATKGAYLHSGIARRKFRNVCQANALSLACNLLGVDFEDAVRDRLIRSHGSTTQSADPDAAAPLAFKVNYAPIISPMSDRIRDLIYVGGEST
jgi:hypothetical protein